METIWDWLDDVNAEGGTGFAGYNDWRIPNKKELESIVNLANYPAVSPEFNTDCAPACTVLTCSCTGPGFYWASSTHPDYPSTAWHVLFSYGEVGAYFDKIVLLQVRAMRGGS